MRDTGESHSRGAGIWVRHKDKFNLSGEREVKGWCCSNMNREVVPPQTLPLLLSTQNKGERGEPPLPGSPSCSPSATLALGGTSQRCGESLAERRTEFLPSHPSSSPSQGSPNETLFAGAAWQCWPPEPPFSLMKGFPLQTSPGHPRCEAAGCCQRCLAPAISASTGVKRRRGCQLLTQPVVALSINSVTTFNYRQGSLKGFKMRRDINSPLPDAYV